MFFRLPGAVAGSMKEEAGETSCKTLFRQGCMCRRDSVENMQPIRRRLRVTAGENTMAQTSGDVFFLGLMSEFYRPLL